MLTQSVGRADTHSTRAQEGELGQEILRRAGVAVGVPSQGFGGLNFYLSLDPLRFDREKSEGTEKTPQSHPPRPWELRHTGARGDSPGLGGLRCQCQTPEVKQAPEATATALGLVVQAGEWEERNDDTVSALQEAGMGAWVIPAINQVRRYEGRHFLAN